MDQDARQSTTSRPAALALVAAVLGMSLTDAEADQMSKPETNKTDLSQVRAEVRAYMDALQVSGKPYGCYQDPRDKSPALYPACDVAITRTIMGEDLKETLTPSQRQEWIAHINSFARPDGSYGPPRKHHSYEHANGMVVGALGVLGGRQKRPVSFYDGFDTPEKVGPWLEKIDWRRQWGGSHLFWGGIHCFSMSRRCTDAWRNAAFAWLDANLDPKTGWWRKGVAPAGPLEPLGGGAHIWPIYQHQHRRFPYPQQVIDSILALQKPNGSWLGFGNYMDLDALYGLAYMSSLAPRHRRDDILAAATKYGRGFVKGWPAYLARKPDLHGLLGAVGSFGLLHQLLPETYTDTVRWTDIFSDARLYQTHSVEMVE
ncbi:MAG: hypothetical protein JXQ73_01920 [Phycisphaerae bacterium]|nr:hypothetical protein [Phycisphaerae bacterium]